MSVHQASNLYMRQNKMIHRGLSQIGMPYNENKGFWVHMFREVVGRKNLVSLSDMTLGERQAVISHLRRRGSDLYNPKIPMKIRDWKKGDPDVLSGKVIRPMRTGGKKTALVKKVGAILADMKLPWKYADGIAKKRFGAELVEWCETGDLYKLVQMLSVHQRRQSEVVGQQSTAKGSKRFCKGDR